MKKIKRFLFPFTGSERPNDGVENEAPARPPNLNSASYDLDRLPPDPRSWLFHALPGGSLVQNIVFTYSLVTDERTEGHGQVENIMKPLGWSGLSEA